MNKVKKIRKKDGENHSTKKARFIKETGFLIFTEKEKPDKTIQEHSK